MGYRYQPSFRHFVGTVEQKQREITGNQIDNIYHLVDFGIERQLTPDGAFRRACRCCSRIATNSTPRRQVCVNAFGDASVGVRSWIFKPPTESGDNISVGVSLKVPDRQLQCHRAAAARQASRCDRHRRPVHAGGRRRHGILHRRPRLQARRLPQRAVLCRRVPVQSPRHQRRLDLPRRARRAGDVGGRPVPRSAAESGARCPRFAAWPPVSAAESKASRFATSSAASYGFRRPGYAISIDPGLLVFPRKLYVFAERPLGDRARTARRSVPDIARGAHGDAAFADYTVMFGMSKRF